MKNTKKITFKHNYNKTHKKGKLDHTIMQTNMFYPKVNECAISDYKSFEVKFGETHAPSDSTNYEKELIKLLHKAYHPTTIKITDDFYGYINYQWLQETNKNSKTLEKEDKYFSQIDNFRLIQNKVYKELIYVVENYIKTNHSKQAKCIKNIYNSYKLGTGKTLRENTICSIQWYSNYVEKNDLYGYIALFNRNEIVNWGFPIYWKVEPDLKNSKVYTSYITYPNLSLYNYELYNIYEDDSIESKKYKKLVKKKYLLYLTELFEACYGKNNILKAEHIWEVEREILSAFECTGKNEAKDNYNLVRKDDAIKKYGFDWDQLCKKLGFKITPETFVCSSPNYLTCICKILNEKWKTPEWKSYFIYLGVRQFIRFDPLTRPIHYKFFELFLRGQPEMTPDDIYAIIPLSYTFNTFLVREYEKLNNNSQNIDFVKRFGEDLLNVFKRIIKNENTWLSPSTKQKALNKLNHIKLDIGRPKVLRYDPLFEYTKNNLYFNLRKLSLWKSSKYVKLVGKPVIDIPLFDWQEFKMVGQQAYIVNAFYTPTHNSIFIPLAYLQPPFIDLEQRGIEYNLSSIGYTIAHELCHSLDENGSKYDENGNLFDWWTEKDKKKYQIIKDDIIVQYTHFALRDGIKFDASIGIGEDIADIAALWICEEYLRDYQIFKEYVPPIIKLSFETFFIYFVLLQKQFIYKKALSSQLASNPHPINKYRTNIPLSRIGLFRSLYNIKKGDGMWWHNLCSVIEDNCKKGKYMKLSQIKMI